MRPFIAATVASALTLVTASGVSAQGQSRPGFAAPALSTPVENVAALLQSGDPREQAWGAWYAGRDAMGTLVPLLQRVVADRAAGGSMAARAAFDAAVDALVQLDAEADPAILPTIHERSPAAALILASSAPRRATAFLLDVVQRDQAEAWFAAANLLLTERPRGFAKLLLLPLSVRVEVRVTEDGSGTVGGGASGIAVGCGALGLAPGLPPWAHYTLTSFPDSGVVVLAIGPTSIYYRRSLSAAGTTPSASVATRGGPSTDDRVRYLASLAGLDDREPLLRGIEWHSVRWQGSGHLQQAIDAIRADLAARHARLVHMLVERSALAPDEAQALPPLPVEVAVHGRKR